MVGADIEGLCRQAAMLAIREFVESGSPTADGPFDRLFVGKHHFEKALEERQTLGASGGSFEKDVRWE
jgi:SpoVK/Ycf46/Vps4 family AAA+-type ATPase